MAIEQSIYTCVRSRRDTGTTGFGYYSFTKGFEQLAESAPAVKKASVGYAAPRNQELWWSNDEDAQTRDREEEAAIRKHHPETFSYLPVEADGKWKAVFAYGRNLGRDIAKSRPGNMLVNLLAPDLEEVKGYPFSYYGSKELFVPYDTNYFYEHGETVVPLLQAPLAMTPGGQISEKEVLRFIGDDRIDLLCSMLQFILDYNDPEQPTRQVMICDKKEHIIYWIAALSLLMPEELAKQFSFTTYSFLAARSDDIRPIYEDVMLCGVYTPAVNGDPADSNATNYEFSREAARPETALFDFEKDSFAEDGLRSSRFSALIEDAVDSDMTQLREYHKFLMQHTTYRKLDNDFARGYSFYLMYQYPDVANLGCLEEAKQFAARYADPKCVHEITEKLMAQTVDQGAPGSETIAVLDLAAEVYGQASVQEQEAVADRYLRCLKSWLSSDTARRDDFVELRESIRSFCSRVGVSYDGRFAACLTDRDILDIGSGSNKKWVLLELAEIILGRMQEQQIKPGSLYSPGSTVDTFKLVMKRLLSDDKNRPELISHYLDAFRDDFMRAAVLDVLYPDVKEGAQKDIRAYLLRRILDPAGAGSMLRALADRDLHEPVMEVLFRLMSMENSKYSFEQVEDLLTEILGSADLYRTKYSRRALDTMRERMLPADSVDEEMEHIYRVFKFSQRCGIEDPVMTGELGQGYKEVVFDLPEWYDLEPKRFAQFQELLRASKGNFSPSDLSAIQNLFLMHKINENLHTQCSTAMLGTAAKQLSFEDMPNEHSRNAVIDRAAEYLFRCTLAEGTAFIDYEKLIARPAEKQFSSPYNRILTDWLYKVIAEAPKKQQRMMTAELIVTMNARGAIEYTELVKHLRKGGIKLQNLTELLTEENFGSELETRFGIRDTGGELKMLVTKLTSAFDDGRGGSFMDKLKGVGNPFGGFRKK